MPLTSSGRKRLEGDVHDQHRPFHRAIVIVRENVVSRAAGAALSLHNEMIERPVVARALYLASLFLVPHGGMARAIY